MTGIIEGLSRPAPAIVKSFLATEEPTGEDPLALLVYGPPGVGKTQFAASAAADNRTAPVLFVDSERGTRGLARWHGTGRLKLFRFRNYVEDTQTLFDYFTSGKFEAEGSPYNTIVIDSLTDIGIRAQHQILAGVRMASKGTPDPDSLEWGEWNKWMNMLRYLIMFFRDTGLHLIVTALEREVEDKQTRVKQKAPAFQGQLAKQLPGFFDTVAHMEVKSVQVNAREVQLSRRFLLQGDAYVIAKDRGDQIGTLSPIEENPTVTSMLDRIILGLQQAEEARDSDPALTPLVSYEPTVELPTEPHPNEQENNDPEPNDQE